MNYKVYLFDFDYTLANSEKGILTCFRHVLGMNGFSGISDNTIKGTIGLTLEDAFRFMTATEDEQLLREYRAQYVKKADTEMNVNTFFYPEAVPLLKRLKANDKKTGIISTKYRYRIEQFLALNGATDLIDLIIGGEDVKAAKPDPQGILKAIEVFGVSSDEVMYVGDNTIDALAGMNAGVDFLGVTTGTTTAEELVEYPHVKIMRTLAELY